jgi:hypothetical protein
MKVANLHSMTVFTNYPTNIKSTTINNLIIYKGGDRKRQPVINFMFQLIHLI